MKECLHGIGKEIPTVRLWRWPGIFIPNIVLWGHAHSAEEGATLSEAMAFGLRVFPELNWVGRHPSVEPATSPALPVMNCKAFKKIKNKKN